MACAAAVVHVLGLVDRIGHVVEHDERPDEIELLEDEAENRVEDAQCGDRNECGEMVSSNPALTRVPRADQAR